MTLKDLEYYETISQNAMVRDRGRNELFEKIDNIKGNVFELPGEMGTLPGMRTITSTDPHDSLAAATKTFASLMPRFELTPLGGSALDLAYAEKIETVLKWHFAQMNRHGVKEPLYEIVKSALDYSAIGIYVEYLPDSMKDRTDARSKYMRRSGDFVWHLYNVRNIHPHYDDYGLTAVTIRSIKTAQEVEDMLGSDHQAVLQMKRMLSFNNADLHNTRMLYSEYIDWENRIRWMSMLGDANAYEQGGDTDDLFMSTKIEIERKAHGLNFFPFVWVQGDDPLLKAVIDTNAWDDLNILLSLRNWLVYRSAAQPYLKTNTINRRGADVNFDDGNGQLNLAPGEAADVLMPRQLDPHLTEILNERQQAIHTSTVARALQTLEFSGNMPFSTINAILTAAVASLTAQRKLAQRAIEEALYIELCCIDSAKSKLIGQRMVTKDEDDETMKRGAQLAIEAGQFDPNDINISVTLQADTPTDRQQRLNEAVAMHDQLKLPLSYCYELVGIDNGEVLHEQWAEGEVKDAEIQVTLKRMANEVDLEFAQKKMEMEMQMQQAQAAQAQGAAQGGAQGGAAQGGAMQGALPANASGIPNGMPVNPNPSPVQGQGFNPASGGQPAQAANPGQGREQVTGKDWTGAGMQGQ